MIRLEGSTGPNKCSGEWFAVEKLHPFGNSSETSEVKRENGSFLEMRQPNGKIRRAAAGGSPRVMDSLDKKFY